jgi:hypothetical protein
MDSCNDTLAGGLPHSEIHGSTPARGSPWLIAACHVLHRLLVPRHPPNALLSLETRRIEMRHPPCTETILRRMLPFIAESFSLSTQQFTPLNTSPIAEHPKAFGQTMRWERPETHQNLIHPDKDLVLGLGPRIGAAIWRHLWRHSSKQKPTTPIAFASPRYTSDHLQHRRGGGDRTRTDDPLLAKQVLSQLSYTPITGSVGGPGRI